MIQDGSALTSSVPTPSHSLGRVCWIRDLFESKSLCLSNDSRITRRYSSPLKTCFKSDDADSMNPNLRLTINQVGSITNQVGSRIKLIESVFNQFQPALSQICSASNEVGHLEKGCIRTKFSRISSKSSQVRV